MAKLSAQRLDTNHNEHEIIKAIEKGLYDREFRKTLEQSINPYGDGKSAKRIVDILEKVPLDATLIQKVINYDI